jgi:hypothetical protein
MNACQPEHRIEYSELQGLLAEDVLLLCIFSPALFME